MLKLIEGNIFDDKNITKVRMRIRDETAHEKC